MSVEEAVQVARRRYDSVEALYLGLLRAGESNWSTLAASARQVAEAAGEWQTAEDLRVAAIPEKQQPEYRQSYEVTEVLANLWRDIAAAHDGS